MLTLLLIACIFGISGFIQGVTGFGSALIAIPLLCLFMDIKTAIPLTALNGMIITAYLIFSLKNHLDGKKLLPLCLASLPGIGVGVTLLKNVNSQTAMFLLGLLLIIYSSYRLRSQPVDTKIDRRWGYFAGFGSGAIGAAFSTGGPPVIIYTALTGWTKDCIKATLTGFFFFNSLMVCTAHGLTGLTTTQVLFYFLISCPFVMLGTLCGARCYGLMAREIYLKSMYILLIIMGLLMITLKS